MITLAYRSEKPDPADIVAVDRSATSFGVTITTREYVQHKAFVLAWRPVWLANKEYADA